MKKIINYDLFLTHAWRFHDDWNRFSEMLDKVPGLLWRNFSLPWHDPAMNANTEVGGRFIREFLESQIIPVHGMVLLSGVYEIKSARSWLDMEIGMARRHNKPIIGIPAIGAETVPAEVAAMCDACCNCNWDGARLVATLDEVMALSKFNVSAGTQ